MSSQASSYPTVTKPTQNGGTDYGICFFVFLSLPAITCTTTISAGMWLG
jgi:hypothetical protein